MMTRLVTHAILATALVMAFVTASHTQESLSDLLARAQRGDAAAQYNLAGIYYLGKGVRQDYAEAVKWYRKAAEHGYAPAQSDLGRMYLDGHGVTQDYAEAAKWYRKAAERGWAPAQSMLGGMYLDGHGVTQ